MAEQYVATASEIERRIWFRMLGQMIPYTDLSVIAALRIFIREGVVEEFLLLGHGLSISTRAWFLNTATGADLDRRLSDFGFSRPPARNATGKVTFTADSSGATVSRGTVVKTNPSDADVPIQRYSVIANPNTTDGSWSVAADSSADVGIQSLDVGATGNVAAYLITAMDSQVAHILSVANQLPVITGKDAATDDETRQAFQTWLAGLSGGNRAAVLAAVLNYLDPDTGLMPVHSAAIQEWDGTTLLEGNIALRIWIEDGSGTANSSLVTKVQRMLDGNDTPKDPGVRSAGIPTLVTSAVYLPISVTAHIDIDRAVGSDLTAAIVKVQIERFIANVPVAGDRGERLIVSQLFRSVMNVAGVLRAHLSMQDDVFLRTGQKVMPGTVTVVTSVV